MFLKELIKKTKIGTYYSIAKRYQWDTEFKQWVDSFPKDNTALVFNEFGEKNPDKSIYYMRFDNSSWGFFAYWKFGLLGLAFAEKWGLVPVIDWTTNSPYYQKDYVECDNPFEYYYEPISIVPTVEAGCSKNVVVYSRYARGFKEMSYIDDRHFDYSVLCKKYYKLKSNIECQINNDIHKLFNSKKTLAVHVRGVEWGQIKGHPVPISLENYYKHIEQALNQGFEQIFLATDSEQTIDYFRNKYANKVVFFGDVLRTPIGSKTLAIFDKTINNNNFRLGYEVLRDMYALALSDGLIAGYSNISLAAVSTKKALEQKYQYIHLFEPEINNNGMSAKEAEKRMRKGKF